MNGMKRKEDVESQRRLFANSHVMEGAEREGILRRCLFGGLSVSDGGRGSGGGRTGAAAVWWARRTALPSLRSPVRVRRTVST